MVLKPKLLSRSALCAAALLMAAVPVFGQATAGRAVIYLGGSYNKANVDNAEQGFFGVDLFAGKMITNNLCIGFSSGYDIVHRYTYTPISSVEGGGGDFTESLAVIPALVRAKYYFTLSPMLQVYAQAGGGAYATIAKLGGNKVGDIRSNCVSPGFTVGAGIDYWFLLLNGVGFEFDYTMFKVPDGGDWFKYWSVRVDYGILKF
jgi:opacity protein-like surface antigen